MNGQQPTGINELGKKGYVIYIRVSTTEQGLYGYSLNAQRQHCEALVSDLGGYVAKICCDEESGGRHFHRRHGYEEAVYLCKKHGWGFVCYDSDRIARDIGTANDFKNSGIEFHIVTMPMADTLNYGMHAVFAQAEREGIVRRIKVGCAEAKKQGVKFGASNEKFSGNCNLSGRMGAVMRQISLKEHLEIDDNAQRIFRKAQKMLADKSLTWKALKAFADDAGFVKRGGKPYNVYEIERLYYEMLYLDEDLASLRQQEKDLRKEYANFKRRNGNIKKTIQDD